ncbi:MAG: hypothetical protein H6698_01035 [Myxococcales bacterium]|nr:hypothetical protein [Myxococcales bacterium]MCB9530975.1 hypothetical protein [Myxococcales bacterium]MCB9532895.1 hypothetical protein [Myxococcales bacterium]
MPTSLPLLYAAASVALFATVLTAARRLVRPVARPIALAQIVDADDEHLLAATARAPGGVHPARVAILRAVLAANVAQRTHPAAAARLRADARRVLDSELDPARLDDAAAKAFDAAPRP